MKYRCFICDFKTNKPRDYGRHVFCHAGTVYETCDLCGVRKQGKRWTEWDRHKPCETRRHVREWPLKKESLRGYLRDVCGLLDRDIPPVDPPAGAPPVIPAALGAPPPEPAPPVQVAAQDPIPGVTVLRPGIIVTDLPGPDGEFPLRPDDRNEPDCSQQTTVHVLETYPARCVVPGVDTLLRVPVLDRQRGFPAVLTIPTAVTASPAVVLRDNPDWMPMPSGPQNLGDGPSLIHFRGFHGE
jgi:hypothetical protein